MNRRPSKWGLPIEDALRKHGPLPWSKLKDIVGCTSPQLKRGLDYLGPTVRRAVIEDKVKYELVGIDALPEYAARGKKALEGDFSVIYVPGELYSFLKPHLEGRADRGLELSWQESESESLDLKGLDPYDKARYHLLQGSIEFGNWVRGLLKKQALASLGRLKRKLYEYYRDFLEEKDLEIREKGRQAVIQASRNKKKLAAGDQLWEEVEADVQTRLRGLREEETDFLVTSRTLAFVETLKELEVRVEGMSLDKLGQFARQITSVEKSGLVTFEASDVVDMLSQSAGLTGLGVFKGSTGKIRSVFSHDQALDLYFRTLEIVGRRKDDLEPSVKARLSKCRGFESSSR